jgi:hypothetical protein
VPNLSFDVFWRDHGAERGLKDLSKGASKSEKDLKNMHDATVVGALGAGVAIVAMGKKSIDVASDISESQSKIGVVFGKSAKSVLDFGDTSSDSLGISKQAALEAAGTFGNLFVSLKLPQSEAAKMSTKMITLAADMASFNNASPEEALEAIRSGLVGETEPLRRFGVNMNDATLREQAMTMGLVDNVKEGLDPAVKAQAAYGLMLAQTGTAQGDFARTSGGLANQQRILKARFTDLQGELGAKLLPVMTSLMGTALTLADVFEKNKEVIVPLVVVSVGLGTAIWTINKATKAAEASQAAYATIMGITTRRAEIQTASLIKLRTAMATIGPAAVVAGTAVGAVWAADKIGQWAVADVKVNELAKSMEKVAFQSKLSSTEAELFAAKGIFGIGKESLNSAEALKKFGDAAYNALDKGWNARLGRMQDMGSSVSSFKKQTQQLDGAFAKMVQDGNVLGAQRQMKLYEDAADKAGVPLDNLRKMFPQYKDALEATKPATQNLTTATKSHTKVVKQDTAALMENSSLLMKSRDSEANYEAAIDDATDSLKTNGHTLDVHTEKGRSNRAALDRIASSTLEWRDAAQKAGASVKKQTAITQDGREELVKMGQRFGLSKKAAQNYAREILGIPKKVKSNIDLTLRNHIPKTLFGVKVGGYGDGLGVRLAQGGKVWGSGTETSDSIPAMLSHNEHVWTAKEVRAAGGHGAVEAMRRSAVQGYARGGQVWGGGAQFERGVIRIAEGTTSRIAKVIEQTASRAMGFNPGLAGALGFARRQAGKPYIWGGVGPNGYDCSGFMSAITNVVKGSNPYHRLFATGGFPAAGFVSGPGAFSIGMFRGNPGHMAGTINGVNVESRGGEGVVIGKRARGARDSLFTGLYHLNGYAKGGSVGDAPFDQLSPYGDNYLGEMARRALLFDNGGLLRSGAIGINRSSRPERVLSAVQTRSFDRLVQVLDRRGAGGCSTAQTPEYIDYGRMGEHVARAISRSGISIKLDGRVVGTMMGSEADLLGRTG